jgi:membrane protease YdiL (CAAX protease family)
MSELTLTPPSPSTTDALAPQPAPWRFWGTLAWGIAAVVAFLLMQFVVLLGLLIWWHADPTAPTADLKGLGSNAVVLSICTFGSVPAELLVVALAVRLARFRFVDYLALKPVDGRTLLFALACTIAYGAALEILTYVSGRPLLVPFVVDLYRSTRETGAWAPMLAAVVVAAPIAEELLFRGFLLRGWSASRLGVRGAVVLTSAIWALMHVQYDWYTIGEIFGLGLVFGYLRLRSGSTLPTILAHAVYSGIGLLQTAILIG